MNEPSSSHRFILARLLRRRSGIELPAKSSTVAEYALIVAALLVALAMLVVVVRTFR